MASLHASPASRWSLLIICCFTLFIAHSAAANERQCDLLAQDISLWQQQARTLNESIVAFDNVLSGQLPPQTEIITRLLAPIGVERTMAEAQAALVGQRQQITASLTQDLPFSVSALPCDELAQAWVQQRGDLAELELRQVRLQEDLLQRGQAVLRVMFRVFRAHQRLTATLNEMAQTTAEVERAESADALTRPQALTRWAASFDEVALAWLKEAMSLVPTLPQANQVWRQARDLPTLDVVAPWAQLRERFGDSAAQWRSELRGARSDLLLSVSHWRNEQVWRAGWSGLAKSIAQPAEFLELLAYEVVSAPAHMWDLISAPFVREYRYYKRQNALPSLITQWASHAVLLLVLLVFIVKLAESIPSWIARAQQASVDHVESTSRARFLSGIFWFVKPNAPWLVVLVLTQVIAELARPQTLIAWVGPLGLLYALFRSTRILFEWLVSRSYSRAGEFIAPNKARQIAEDCETFAWVITLCGVIWWLGIGTGGGYVRFLIVVAALVIAWWALHWLLFRHLATVQRFLGEASWFRAKEKSAQDTPGLLRRAMRAFNLPLHFLFVHLIDAVRSLNQKLLDFDGYRAFSVKLLRARLESKAEEPVEDEAEPDENYSDWMRRKAHADMIMEVGEPARLLEPLQHWHKDKTDENVVMLVGDAGSGKTSFIERLPAMWQETEVDYMRFENKTMTAQAVFDKLAETLHQKTIEDVSALVKLDAELEPRVIVIDDAQNLFLAEVGCFDAYKALLQCMNAQLNNIFWVVVMHAPSWAYLSCVFSREQRISNVYRMNRWSPQEIRRLVLSRHQGSKRRLRYNELLLSASASSESSSVRSADSRVFNILWEQSGGNPSIALEIWLNAAKVKGRMIEMGVPQRPDAAPLKTLKNDLYFVFAAIVVHRRLSTAEIMQVTHFAEPLVRHALKQGINLGLINREADGRYTVDPYWRATLTAFLMGKNLLWSA